MVEGPLLLWSKGGQRALCVAHWWREGGLLRECSPGFEPYTHKHTHTHTLLRAVLFSNASREAVRKENPSMPVKDVAR